MDAGARGRRLLQRKEYKAKVSEFIPKELEDQFSHDENGQLVFELDLKKVGQKIKTGLKNFINKPIMKDYPTKKEYQDAVKSKTSTQFEASDAQMKAMHDAKVKKMEDDKVAQKKKKVDEACWKGYEKKGMKTMFGKRYPNCVKKTKKEEVELEAKKSCGEGEYYCHDDQKCKPIPDGMKVGKDGMLVKEDMKGMSQKSGDKRSTESGAGMTAKGVAKYNRRTGGNLKTAVTTPPSKLKPGSKAAKRRKSFCARSKSWTGPRGKAARRRWNCEYEPELPMIDEKKKLHNTSPLSDRVSNWSKKINEGITPGRNDYGLPTGLKSNNKTTKTKKVDPKNLPVAMASYEPQGEMIERKMTSSEKDKKEKYVKGMKKDKSGFTKRYGKDGKSVMYATATKMAMRKEAAMGTIAGTAAAITLGGMGINAIRKQLQNKKKMDKGGEFKSGSPLDRIQKTNQMIQQMSYEPEGQMIEAKYEKGASTYGKASIRNKRAYGYGGNAKPPAERGAAITRRKDEHMARRGVKKGNKYAPDKYKPTVYGRDEDNDKYRKNKNVKEQQIPQVTGLGGGGGGTNAITDKAKTKTIGNYAKDALKIASIPARFMLNIKSPQDPLSKFAAPTTAAGKVDSALADYKRKLNMGEGSLHSWFKGSKSKDGKPGWVNVVTGGTCASDKKGEGTPKCVSSSKRASMTKAERLSASRRKKKADPGQQSKSGAAKPTYVATDKKKKVDEMNQGPSSPVGNYDGKIMPKFGAGRISNVRLKGGKTIADLLKKV